MTQEELGRYRSNGSASLDHDQETCSTLFRCGELKPSTLHYIQTNETNTGKLLSHYLQFVLTLSYLNEWFSCLSGSVSAVDRARSLDMCLKLPAFESAFYFFLKLPVCWMRQHSLQGGERISQLWWWWCWDSGWGLDNRQNFLGLLFRFIVSPFRQVIIIHFQSESYFCITVHR